MNRDELLERLAMELCYWPGSMSMPEPPIRGMWTNHAGWECFAKGDNTPITQTDWLAERERLINKPSWDSHDYGEVRQDKFGEWQGRYIGGSWSRIRDGHMPTGHRWQDTLECRPTLTTSLGASGWDEDRIDIIGSNGNDGLAYSAPAWNGEGLPPVGANCLMQSHILGMWANEWLEVEVLAHKPPLMIGWCEEKQIAIWSDACRPIRSDEDKAVEEMLGGSGFEGGVVRALCRALYREGYRKLEAAQ